MQYKWIVTLVLTLCSANALTQTSDASLAQALRTQLTSSSDVTLQQLYQQHDYQPLWHRQQQITPQALALLNLLRDAARFGLRASDYAGNDLTYQLVDGARQSVAQQAQFELLLSAAAVRFVHDLHYGRIEPRQVGFNLAARNDLSVASVLLALSSTADVPAEITRIEPQYLHYQLLKQALARYRLLAIDVELTQLPAFTQRSINTDEAYEGAPALRRLLIAEGDLDSVAMNEQRMLDAPLVQGLQRYQQRHGLKADGTLGKQTFTALTTPFAHRVRQIELTLERWRWLPPPQSPMIVVNIPQFKLFAFESQDDREAHMLRMDVIVGQAFIHTQTPIFVGSMQYVVFRPYWNVPRNIVEREILPALEKHQDYLQHNDLELVRSERDDAPVIPITAASIAELAAGSVRLRQRPGEQNALGRVKFMLPNSYNVYLHSTPAQHLFGESRRSFSHGCIRVSDPTALAEYVLRNASGEWDKARIETAMQGKPNQRVNLEKAIPVLIVYGTAMVNEAGQVQFFDDIYGYDVKLAKLL